jgi:hypothetical protein
MGQWRAAVWVPGLWRAGKYLNSGVAASEGNLRILLHLPIHAPLAPQGWAAGVDGDLRWRGWYGGSRGKAGASWNGIFTVGKMELLVWVMLPLPLSPLVNRVNALGRGGNGVYEANGTAYGVFPKNSGVGPL